MDENVSSVPLHISTLPLPLPYPFLCTHGLPPLYPLQFLAPLFSLPSSVTTLFFCMLASRYFADSFISYMEVLSTRGVTLSRVPKISDSSGPMKAPYKFVPKSAARSSHHQLVVSRSKAAENGNGLSWVREDRQEVKTARNQFSAGCNTSDFIPSAHKRHSYIQQQYHWHWVSRKDSNSWMLCTVTLSLSFSVLSSLADLPFHLNQNEGQNIKKRLDSITSRCSGKQPARISPNSLLR